MQKLQKMFEVLRGVDHTKDSRAENKDPNEKNELVRMLTYVVHCKKQDHYYVSGLQFVGIESRKSSWLMVM
jgi:hypothetical protein